MIGWEKVAGLADWLVVSIAYACVDDDSCGLCLVIESLCDFFLLIRILDAVDVFFY